MCTEYTEKPNFQEFNQSSLAIAAYLDNDSLQTRKSNIATAIDWI